MVVSMNTTTPFIGCLHPQKIVNPYTHEMVCVPCGKCDACRCRAHSRYALQCRLEAQSSFKVVFITLTYANSLIPRLGISCDGFESNYGMNEYLFCDKESGEYFAKLPAHKTDIELIRKKVNLFGDVGYLDKRSLQLFMKRLRKQLYKYSDEKIRYFACGEYGPVHFRPHFHILLFLESATYLQDSGETLSSFPKWTWSKAHKCYPTDKLSILEYCVRSCWKYGCVDADIAKGDCAAYVAGYVNGFSTLPQVLQLPKIRPFALHSAFLGCKLCKTEREKVYASTPACFVRKSLSFGEFSQEYDVWRSYYSIFYPRCQGYAFKSSRERLYSYRIYSQIRDYYPALASGEQSLMSVCIDLACMVDYYCTGDSRNVFDKDTPIDFVYLIGFLAKDLGVKPRPFSPNDPDCMASLITRIYSRVLLSRHFLNFVCNGNYNQSVSALYLSKIEDFYNYLEQNKLTRFYESQQDYFLKDYANTDDWVYFYDNVYYDVEEMKSHPAWSEFLIQIQRKKDKLTKHKRLNDLNNIFSNI